ncbi:MAG TPA: hypothetical protein VES67_07190 [Vicinamibacterales bacterium]|nr:hypothetical protein [Vicinamibacterales bacterium]
MLTKRPCRICRHWFVPDRRIGRRQRACSAPACQVARRARTQASWRRRNPDYFIAHRIQRRRLKAGGAQAAVLPLVLPPPLSQLPWDLAQEAFGVAGTDFLGHLGRVLLGAVQDQKAGQVIDPTGETSRLPQ